MRLAIAALTAALLLVGTKSLAQGAAGTTENAAAAAQPSTAPLEPAVRPPVDPKPRSKSLLDLFNELVRPRPAPEADQAAPAPSGAVPAAVDTAPGPAGPTAESGTGAQGALPRDVKAEPSQVPPRPVEATEQAPPLVAPTVAEAAAAASDANAAAAPASTVAEQLPAEERPTVATVASPRPNPVSIGWLLVGLLAAAAVAASVLHLRRTRRIVRTRAALALEPRFDLAAGACTFTGLSLACPPLAIRTRLDLGETPRG